MSAWSKGAITNFVSLSAISLIASGSIACGIVLSVKTRNQHTTKGIVGSASKVLYGPGYDLVIDFRTIDGLITSATAQTRNRVEYRVGEPVNVRYDVYDPSRIQVDGLDQSLVGRWLILLGLFVLLAHAIKVVKGEKS